MRVGIRVGGAVVIIAVVVGVVLTQVGGSGSGSVPPQLKNPHVPVEAIPASMSSTWVQPPAGSPGPEGIPIPSGPKLATLLNAATGQTVDGVQCQTGEQTVVHVHTHLTIFVNGKAQVMPYGIGIPGFQAVQTRAGSLRARPGAASTGCTRTATTGSSTSNRRARRDSFTLGQFFDEWGHPAQQHPGRAGTGQGHRLLHLPGQEGGLYTGNPGEPPARRPLPDPARSSGRRSWRPSRSPTGASL